jgi:hypothetical protein
MTILVLKLPDVKRKTEGRPPILSWGDLSALGTGTKTCQRYLLSERASVSVSLLPVWTDLPTLSGEDDGSGSDGTAAAVCGDLLEVWVELSESKHDPEWLEDRTVSDDGLAGCTRAS